MKNTVFSCPVQIRMSDLDPFNHVNNGCQMNLYDYGRTQFLEHVLQTEIDWLTFEWVLVHVDLDFRLPIRIHDKIVCETELVEMGNSSVKLQQRMLNTVTGEVMSTCNSVLVYFDRVANHSKLIPESFKSLFI